MVQRRLELLGTRVRVYLISSVLHSGAGGELVEEGLPAWSPCTGVCRRRLVVLEGRWGRRFSTLKVRWWLLVLQKTGGWIELEVPTVAVVIGGEV